MSVPAWPMPTQNTKLTMGKPQPTGDVVAPHAHARGHQQADQRPEHAQQDAAMIKQTHHQSLGGFCVSDVTFSVMAVKLSSPVTNGARDAARPKCCPLPGRADHVGD